LSKLQIGGERGYGWGRVSLEDIKPEVTKCFDDYHYDGMGDHPSVVVPSTKKLLAHTNVGGVESNGSIEPFIGRETQDSRYFGKNLTANLCWIPGSTIFEEKIFRIMPRGVWKEAKTSFSS